MKEKRNKKFDKEIVININNEQKSDEKKSDKNHGQILELMIKVAIILLNKIM